MLSDKIARAVREQNSSLENFNVQEEAIAGFAGRVAESFQQGGRLLLLGNGSLGAVANLVANQFMHRLALERPPLPVLSLCHDITLATALERDGQGRQFFARQLRVVATPEDIVLALAGFHREEALEEGLTVSRQAGCLTAVLRPGPEETVGESPDFLFRLDTISVPRAIEGALFFGHLLCEMIEGELFGT